MTAGEISIGGRIVNELEPKDRDISMVFQNYALYPHMSVYDNMAYGLRIRGMSEGRDRGARAQGGEHPGARQFPAAQAAPAFRRATPAGGDGARDRARAGRVPVRRAALQPRCQAAGADAHRDQAAPSEHSHHQHLRDPRSGRGDDARRSPDRHARGPRRADRQPDRGLSSGRRPRSWPVSSARPR